MDNSDIKRGFDPNKPFLKSIYGSYGKNIIPAQTSQTPVNFYKTTKVSSDFKKSENKKSIKYRYNSPNGNKIAGGGILFFEEKENIKGVWLIEEKSDYDGATVYTDFGGKYDINDGDIVATIGREFREETYNTAEIPYAQLKELGEDHYIYINGYDGFPSYLCIISDIKKFKITFDSKKVIEEREKVIKANPQIPSEWYKTLDIKFITLKDIYEKKKILSSRLYAILEEIKISKICSKEIKEFFK